MGFWIFMLCMNLLIPTMMIGFGWYFRDRAPKNINPLVGYRTVMSMKNRDTWEFAHHYFGRVWFILGWILLPLSIVAMCFVLGKTEDTVSTYGGIVCFVQCLLLIYPIYPTEKALKRHFDQDGNKK